MVCDREGGAHGVRGRRGEAATLGQSSGASSRGTGSRTQPAGADTRLPLHHRTCVGVTARTHWALRDVAARVAFRTRVKPEGHVDRDTGVEPAPASEATSGEPSTASPHPPPLTEHELPRIRRQRVEREERHVDGAARVDGRDARDGPAHGAHIRGVGRRVRHGEDGPERLARVGRKDRRRGGARGAGALEDDGCEQRAVGTGAPGRAGCDSRLSECERAGAGRRVHVGAADEGDGRASGARAVELGAAARGVQAGRMAVFASEWRSLPLTRHTRMASQSRGGKNSRGGTMRSRAAATGPLCRSSRPGRGSACQTCSL